MVLWYVLILIERIMTTKELMEAQSQEFANAAKNLSKASFMSGYNNAVEKAYDWLTSNAIRYVGNDGVTRWRELYRDFNLAMEL